MLDVDTSSRLHMRNTGKCVLSLLSTRGMRVYSIKNNASTTVPTGLLKACVQSLSCMFMGTGSHGRTSLGHNLAVLYTCKVWPMCMYRSASEQHAPLSSMIPQCHHGGILACRAAMHGTPQCAKDAGASVCNCSRLHSQGSCCMGCSLLTSTWHVQLHALHVGLHIPAPVTRLLL